MGSRGNAAPDRAVRFGRYTLDRDGLRRGKQEVRLTPKALEVLRVLVDRAGRLVSKQELLETVWSGRDQAEADVLASGLQFLQTLGLPLLLAALRDCDIEHAHPGFTHNAKRDSAGDALVRNARPISYRRSAERS